MVMVLRFEIKGRGGKVRDLPITFLLWVHYPFHPGKTLQCTPALESHVKRESVDMGPHIIYSNFFPAEGVLRQAMR